MSQIEPRSCKLRLAAQGQAEPCPRELCVFWEPGGAVVRGACIIDRLGLDVRRADLAACLLAARDRLERARDLTEAAAAHEELSRRVGLAL